MNGNLMRLYARNRDVSGRKFSAVVAEGETDATLYIYDVIVDSEADAEWWGGVAPGAFAKQLAALNGKTIHLRINSPGGSVFGARAMEQAIREHDGKVIAHIDGYAASAASFLMLAASEVVMAPGAMVMIHNAWAIAYGNADDMMQMAALLSKIDGTLVETYCQRTKKDKQTVCDWMAAETWFTAEEAVAAGFADSIAATSDASAKAKAPVWNLSAYANAPKAQVCGAACPSCGASCCGMSKCAACGADCSSACSCESCGTACCGFMSCPSCCAPCCSNGSCDPADEQCAPGSDSSASASAERDDYVRRLEHLNRIAA